MDPDDQPKGTLVILIIYLVLMLLAWLCVYFIMLSRGGG
jgi:hypothetical protein